MIKFFTIKKFFHFFKKLTRPGHENLKIFFAWPYYGRGITKDHNKAFEWYSKSADNGNAEGLKGLGDRYYHGRGTTQDYNKAF